LPMLVYQINQPTLLRFTHLYTNYQADRLRLFPGSPTNPTNIKAMTALISQILSAEYLNVSDDIKGWYAFFCESDDETGGTAFYIVPLYRQLLWRPPLLKKKLVVDEIDEGSSKTAAGDILEHKKASKAEKKLA